MPYSAGSLLLALLLVPSNAIAEEAKADVATSIVTLTGAETRIVWLRNKQWETSKGEGAPLGLRTNLRQPQQSVNYFGGFLKHAV